MSKSLTKRSRQKKETRNRIVTAAMCLIADQGLSEFKTLGVAKKANISHGAVFVHFPSKEDLLNHTIETLGSSLISSVHEIVEDKRGLLSVLEAHLELLQKNTKREELAFANCMLRWKRSMSAVLH